MARRLGEQRVRSVEQRLKGTAREKVIKWNGVRYGMEWYGLRYGME